MPSIQIRSRARADARAAHSTTIRSTSRAKTSSAASATSPARSARRTDVVGQLRLPLDAAGTLPVLPSQRQAPTPAPRPTDRVGRPRPSVAAALAVTPAPAATPAPSATGPARPEDLDLGAIVLRARTGDPRAFQQLVDHLTPIYHRHVMAVIGAPDVADDIIQQAFVKAHEHLSEMTGRFDGWVFRIVSNLCKDHLRNIRTTQHDSYEEDVLTSALPTPDRALEQQELRAALNQAIASLPASYREAFIRHEVHEESYEEIGAALGTSKGAIKMRVHRAREQLRDLLAVHVA